MEIDKNIIYINSPSLTEEMPAKLYFVLNKDLLLIRLMRRKIELFLKNSQIGSNKCNSGIPITTGKILLDDDLEKYYILLTL